MVSCTDTFDEATNIDPEEVENPRDNPNTGEEEEEG